VQHLVEIWKMKGPRGAIHTPACLSCGWVGEETNRRVMAVREGEMHERGERWPWQVAPGETRSFDGDPRSQRAA
jgi:hypothetical protein